MAGAFSKEFEKWLQRSEPEDENSPEKGNGNNDDDDDDDDEDVEIEEESDSESDMDSTDDSFDITDDSDSEEENNLRAWMSKAKSKLARTDSAPILVDDDEDDDFPMSKTRFEDEPPVLEPVSKHQAGGPKISTLGGIKPSQKNRIRNFQTYARKKSAEVNLRTYSKKTKRQFPNRLDKEKLIKYLKSKDGKESGNIFDKFSPLSESPEDTPPPLIPSPEAILVSDSPNPEEKADGKHLTNSPDFCAMEADSTSEISSNKGVGATRVRQFSKNSAHGDVLIECDSTCMLSASPVIVSPASVSNSEMDDGKDSGDGQNGESKTDVKGDDIEKGGKQAEKVGNLPMIDESRLKADSDRKVLGPKSASKSASASKSLLNNHSDIPPSLSLPLTAYPVQSDATNGEMHGFPNDPPILSIVSSSVKPLQKSRRKRHTIDCPETVSRSSVKRACTLPKPEPEPEKEEQSAAHACPPVLTHVSETVINFSPRVKRSKPTEHPKKDCPCCKQANSRGRRHHRCNTLPFDHLHEYTSHLSSQLGSFVTVSCELSELQSRMHNLLQQILPELRGELRAMSPESSQFQSFLADLVLTLEQPDEEMEVEEEEEESTEPPPLIPYDSLAAGAPPLCSPRTDLIYDNQTQQTELNDNSLSQIDLNDNSSQAANNVDSYSMATTKNECVNSMEVVSNNVLVNDVTLQSVPDNLLSGPVITPNSTNDSHLVKHDSQSINQEAASDNQETEMHVNINCNINIDTALSDSHHSPTCVNHSQESNTNVICNQEKVTVENQTEELKDSDSNQVLDSTFSNCSQKLDSDSAEMNIEASGGEEVTICDSDSDKTNVASLQTEKMDTVDSNGLAVSAFANETGNSEPMCSEGNDTASPDTMDSSSLTVNAVTSDLVNSEYVCTEAKTTAEPDTVVNDCSALNVVDSDSVSLDSDKTNTASSETERIDTQSNGCPVVNVVAGDSVNAEPVCSETKAIASPEGVESDCLAVNTVASDSVNSVASESVNTVASESVDAEPVETEAIDTASPDTVDSGCLAVNSVASDSANALTVDSVNVVASNSANSEPVGTEEIAIASPDTVDSGYLTVASDSVNSEHMCREAKATSSPHHEGTSSHSPSVTSSCTSLQPQAVESGQIDPSDGTESGRESPESELVIPDIAQLTLREKNFGIRNARVILHKDPGVLLRQFSLLSCKALQLLLPDLAVSLCNELAQSPHDLMVFIENVVNFNLKGNKLKET